jgi:hypothetical protein
MAPTTLVKDQWWFIILTAMGQALVALVAVYVGARLALKSQDTVRRRQRSAQAAEAILGLLGPLASALFEIKVAAELPAFVYAGRITLSDARERVRLASLDLLHASGEAAHLPQGLRRSAFGATQVALVAIHEIKEESFPFTETDDEALAHAANRAVEYIDGVTMAYGQFLRGEPCTIPLPPPPIQLPEI